MIRRHVVEAKSSRLATKAEARALARIIRLELEFGDLTLPRVEQICRELASATEARLAKLAYGGTPGAITAKLIVARAIRAARRVR